MRLVGRLHARTSPKSRPSKRAKCSRSRSKALYSPIRSSPATAERRGPRIPRLDGRQRSSKCRSPSPATSIAAPFRPKASSTRKPGSSRTRPATGIAFNGASTKPRQDGRRMGKPQRLSPRGDDPERRRPEETNFAKLWAANRASTSSPVDVPTRSATTCSASCRKTTCRPASRKAERCRRAARKRPRAPSPPPPLPSSICAGWSGPSSSEAPKCPTAASGSARRLGGRHRGRTRCARSRSMYDNWPPRLLIADEVGLGKTIRRVCCSARLGWRARRGESSCSPPRVCHQWQIELREKFNLNWPIYDGQKLVWYPSPSHEGAHGTCGRSQTDWHKEPAVIVSSQMVRRQERAARTRWTTAEPWDLMILDEAHHARRRVARALRPRAVRIECCG